MTMQILVTGAGGFLGGALCRSLASKGCRVLAMTRAALSDDSPVGVTQWLIDDLAELPPDSAQRLAAVDIVVHCAGRAHRLADTAADPLAEFRKVNRDATLSLARMAAASGVKRFVFVSSIGVNGSQSGDRPFTESDVPNPDSAYAQSKWEAEQALTELAGETGMKVYIVRPPLIYGANAPGNFALLVRLVRTGLPLPFGALSAPRSFVSLDNMVDMLTYLVDHEDLPAGTYLVSDGKDVSTATFIREMARALGKRTFLLPVPAKILEFLAGLLGRREQIRKMAVPLAIDIHSSCEQLRWVPRWTLEQSMRKALGGSRNAQTYS